MDQFHGHLTLLGTPYKYFQDDTVVCLDLQNSQVSVGAQLYYKDSLQCLFGLKVICLQQDKQSIETFTNGKIGIKVDIKVPRNKEILR